MCLPKPRNGSHLIILAGLLLLLLLLPVSLQADTPLGELEQILTNYERITKNLQIDFDSVKKNSQDLQVSMIPIQNSIELLQKNSQERELRLQRLETLSTQDKETLMSSVSTLKDLQTGYTDMVRSLKISRIKTDIAIATTILVIVASFTYFLTNPP
ncbi:hypothetical protein [uncultured Sphaerochaeta sp.]|uniref:hypothetical protein n=1 Tax=uncultured Sphaerochaeta sp. TaxID=886478 RepID=UPI002A0A2B6B|nr:hypothetical protein [uncultured Sphaerochaeta sp.]